MGKIIAKNPTLLRKRLILSIFSILLAILLLEGCTRLFLDVHPMQERFNLHPAMGWEWSPGYAALETNKGYDYYLEISAQGLPLSPHYEIPKPENHFRVLALGDSITHGLYVEKEHKFVTWLEALLQPEFPDWIVEVVNGGTDDYGTEQEMLWLAERGLRFEPDLIVLTVYLNDSRPSVRLNPFAAASYNTLNTRSHAYYFYSQFLRQQMLQREVDRDDFRFRYVQDLEQESWKTEPAALKEMIESANQDWGLPWTENGMGVWLADLEGLLALIRDTGVPVMVVITPVSVQVEAQVNPAPPYKGLDYPQQVLLDYFEQKNYPVVDLLPAFRDAREGNMFLDQAHYSIEGHAIAARTIFEGLIVSGMLPDR